MLPGCGSQSLMYSYRAATENCQCEEFRTTDRQYNIEYRFRARYAMNHGVVTTIEVEFLNHSDDTLFLDPGVVRISSRNVQYRYNDKFIPLPHLIIPPSRSDNVVMTGSDISQKDDWNKIAGEQLTVTLKGIRLGLTSLAEKSVTFIPENPKLKVAP